LCVVVPGSFLLLELFGSDPVGPGSTFLQLSAHFTPAALFKFVAVVWAVEPSYIRYRRYLFQSSSLLDAASSFKLSQRLFTHPPVFRVLLHKKQKEQPSVPMSSSLLKRSPAVERTVGLFDVGRGNCRRRDRGLEKDNR
ncbi:hypothetical protein CMEL01_13946, partial [Colletotrichum melonis]